MVDGMLRGMKILARKNLSVKDCIYNEIIAAMNYNKTMGDHGFIICEIISNYISIIEKTVEIM